MVQVLQPDLNGPGTVSCGGIPKLSVGVAPKSVDVVFNGECHSMIASTNDIFDEEFLFGLSLIDLRQMLVLDEFDFLRMELFGRACPESKLSPVILAPRVKDLLGNRH